MAARGRRVAVLAVAGLLALSGCAGAPSGGGERDKPTVLTTFTVLQDMASAVAGEHVTVESITKPGAEIHDYEPTPQDVAKASEAQLVLDNGLHLEQWLEQFTASANVPHTVVSEGVEAVDIAGTPGTPNPHAWMSPANGERYVDNIVTALSGLDPEHSQQFRENGEAYKAQIREIGDGLTKKLDALPRDHRSLVTCEGAFSYLARDAGLTEKYIWPVNAEQEATPQQVSSAIEFVDRHHVPAVFCESTVSDKPMRQVMEATGARWGGTLYVDSLSEKDGPVPTYLDLLRHDADTIARGLSGGAR
ncbi:metal ABC transporter substrate-binding protein [Kocuria sp.]|uniref:metal ABC transporter substrate-binding protein n=1 Tax=Kocuria sp. TaxID=1871328 RepID=UPI0026DB38E8|nr:metal ABC transporter substrate-binding protein [Kocuria sp.]MDO4917999.1 metal ABC transporter substrate-binding protein [Kocuria sp.]